MSFSWSLIKQITDQCHLAIYRVATNLFPGLSSRQGAEEIEGASCVGEEAPYRKLASGSQGRREMREKLHTRTGGYFGG